ncbi:MAG: caspase family protein [Saprospiraceae bacterium]|nr:caspase family protein [Saprospiraceae bacterium]
MRKLLLLCLALPFYLAAQTEKSASPLPPQNSNLNTQNSTRAVVIGISDYQDTDIPDLRFADRDATAFAAYLQSPAGGTLPPENIKLLTNKAATTGAIAAAMDWLIADCKAGERAIIYFSGHGDVETRTKFQRGFLLTYDSPASNYLAGAFALIFLQDIISTLADQGVQVVMISDACHAGKLAGSDIGGSQATTANMATQFANEIKILSCQPDEFSLEGEQWGGGRGCFSYHLIEGLTGLADGNTDKQVNLLEINRYLEEVVPKETAPQMQIPMTVGGKSVVLAAVDEAGLARLREQKGKALPAMATIESKGFEQVVLAGIDSIWQKKYAQFAAALQRGELLEPAGANAYDLYRELAEVPELSRLQGIMKRNLATALQDESQQAINAYLRSDEEELAARSRGESRYRKFVNYLEKATELLGSDHYMYKTLKAKQYYFDAVDTRVRFADRTFSLTDSSLIWRTQCEATIREALKWEENAAFIYNELFILSPNRHEKLSYLQKALELAPQWATLYSNLGNHFLEQNELEKADSALSIAIRLAPSFSMPYRVYGTLYRRQNKPEQAETMYKKAIEISPGNVEHKKTLGYFYKEQKRFQDAENQWLQVLELSPEDNQTYNELSSMYNQFTQEFEKSIAINLRRLKLRPTDGDAFADLLVAYRDAGRFDKIPAVVEDMKHLDATINNWEGTAILGRWLFDLGQKEEGLAFQKKGIRIAPESGWGHYLIAFSYRSMGDFETFLAHIDTALTKRMSYWHIEWYSYVPKAVGSPGYQAYVQKWMEKFPNWGFCQSLMGVYYDEKRDWKKALEYHKKAVELSPESEKNWYYYACSAYKSGLGNADSAFQKCIALNPCSQNNLLDIGNFYKSHGEAELAEQLFKAALKCNPDFVYTYQPLSLLYFFSERKQEAYAVLEEAQKKAPNDLGYTALLATLLYYDQPQSAKAYVDEIAKVEPMANAYWECIESMRMNSFEYADACWQILSTQPLSVSLEMTKYKYLQMKVRQGEKEKAIQLLAEILEKYVFVEYKLFSTDLGLDPIRDLEPFKELMRRHFPEKTND